MFKLRDDGWVEALRSLKDSLFSPEDRDRHSAIEDASTDRGQLAKALKILAEEGIWPKPRDYRLPRPLAHIVSVQSFPVLYRLRCENKRALREEFERASLQHLLAGFYCARYPVLIATPELTSLLRGVRLFSQRGTMRGGLEVALKAMWMWYYDSPREQVEYYIPRAHTEELEFAELLDVAELFDTEVSRRAVEGLFTAPGRYLEPKVRGGWMYMPIFPVRQELVIQSWHFP